MKRPGRGQDASLGAEESVALEGYAGGKTSGVASTARLPNSKAGTVVRRKDLAKPRPGMNGNIVSHVEAHAAALMRTQGMDEATLFINRMPCSGGNGCLANISQMVPAGKTLNIFVMEEGSSGPFTDWIHVTGTGPQ